MTSQKDDSHKKDESYWLGVRDALRMVDSFLKWSKRHPDRAKGLDDFINDGLIAAAKRCEECLSYALGVEFRDRDEYEESDIPGESPSEIVEEPDFEEDIQAEGSVTDSRPASHEEPSFEMAAESSIPRVISDEEQMETEMDSFPEVPDVQESDSVSESESTAHESMEDEEALPSAEEEISDNESIKDFSKEFHLGEPQAMETTQEEDETEEYEAQSAADREDKSKSSSIESPDEDSAVESEEVEEDEFTWDDYEDALTPRVASPYGASEEEAESQSDEEEAWSPLDDPTVEEDASAEMSSSIPEETEEEEIAQNQEETSKKQTRPEPPPPPPPQDEEDEDERRKRARRLFFGA